jgi:tRNA(Ile)-lysidine synthase
MPKSSLPNGGILLAVSGGVDSMLLAHIFATSLSPADRSRLKISHFNHGLRPDSGQDESLVRDFAAQHNIEFVSEKANLPDCSEDTARKARHEFLAKTAGNSPVATAHHLDDLVESIAINLSRGTGWRGLAVLNRANYIRPLLSLEKSEIQSLAREFGIKWREDSTNRSPKYLRNRLREKTASLPFDTKWKLLQLREAQIKIAQEIEALLQEYQPDLQRRDFYNSAKTDEFDILTELLRYTLLRQNIRSTRPELRQLLHAIQTYEPGKKFQLAGNKFILVRRHDFVVLG